MKTIIFHPMVYAEIDAIMTYYENVAGFALADRFFADFRETVLAAALHPSTFSLREGRFRRANLKCFPYNFLFRDLTDQVRILTIRHHRRNPAFGTDRA